MNRFLTRCEPRVLGNLQHVVPEFFLQKQLEASQKIWKTSTRVQTFCLLRSFLLSFLLDKFITKRRSNIHGISTPPNQSSEQKQRTMSMYSINVTKLSFPTYWHHMDENTLQWWIPSQKVSWNVYPKMPQIWFSCWFCCHRCSLFFCAQMLLPRMAFCCGRDNHFCRQRIFWMLRLTVAGSEIRRTNTIMYPT